MVRPVVTFFLGTLLGLLAAVAALFLLDPAVEAPPPATSEKMSESFDALVDALDEAGEFVEGHQWYGTEREQAESYRHILRTFASALEERFFQDARFPYFRVVRPRTKTGMDNPDQRYLIAALDGRFAYRIWGTRGSSRRLDFTLYVDEIQGRTISSISTEDLEVDDDGNFEVILSTEPREGNWLASEPIPVRILVRHVFSDWNTELPGEVHIDRLDVPSGELPRVDAEIINQRLLDLSADFAERVRHWPEFSRTVIGRFPPNWLSPPRDTGAEGGLPGRLMVGGHYVLEDDEALVIRSYPSHADYQGIQLGHHWWQSLDYADRQTSLTTDQARLSSDGANYFVIAHEDPGVANWLDTEGFQRAEIFMRYDGMYPPEISPGEEPTASVVPLAEVFTHLPPDEPRISPSERAARIALRRRHVQRRVGN